VAPSYEADERFAILSIFANLYLTSTAYEEEVLELNLGEYFAREGCGPIKRVRDMARKMTDQILTQAQSIFGPAFLIQMRRRVCAGCHRAEGATDHFKQCGGCGRLKYCSVE
jgi:hypothetical protein